MEDNTWLRHLPELTIPDPDSGCVTHVKYDADSDRIVASTTQDVTEILEENKVLQNEDTGRMGEFVRAAQIPITVQMEWLTKYGIDAWEPNHAGGVRRLLNSPDYRYLKTRNIII